MTKGYLVSLLVSLAGFMCIVSFSIIGSQIDEYGFLVEPFYLIPIGYFLIVGGILGLVFTTLLRYFAPLIFTSD